jgi:uncharacterized membrane-anchored protein YhcB (DUF1043 family)
MPAEAVPAVPPSSPASPAAAVVAVPPVDPKAALPKAAEPATPPPTKAEPPKEAPGVAFARLAKAERARVEKEQAFKREMESERAKLASERAEIQKALDEAKAIREAEAKAKSDPVGYLEKLYGADWYEKFTEMKLAGGKTHPDLAVRAVKEEVEGQIAALRREQEEARKREAEERQKAADAEKTRIEAERAEVLQRFRAETAEFVKAHAEDYELTNLYEQHDLVAEVIEAHFAETKRVLSQKEAADLVEKHLEEQVEKAAKAKKLASKFAPPPKAEEPPKPAPTLSNGAAAAPSFLGSPKTEEERLARAMAAMDAKAARTAT